MARVRLTRGKHGENVAPVFWNDNYVSLLPGEKRELTANYDVSALGGAEPVVEVDGWNVAQGAE
jgi:exo-1,4-beta-D-glucosaminidase